MRLLFLTFILLSALCYFIEADDSYENETENVPPKVAWVPIIQRNMTATVGKALEGDDERLARIGKMLEKSYDKINHDVAEGQTLIQELELKSLVNISPFQLTTTSTTTIISIILIKFL